MTSLDVSPLSAQVEKLLKNEILAGNFVVGEKLDLSKCAERFGVSISPVRDAVKRLEGTGLLTISPRRGVYIGELDREKFRHVMEVRIVLECKAVELAVARIPKTDALSVLKSYTDAHTAFTTMGHEEVLSQVDNLVHNLCIRYCGNPLLTQMMENLRDIIEWAHNTITDKLPRPYETTFPEHIAICEAICDKNVEGAVDAMHTHLQRTSERLLGKLEDSKSSGQPVAKRLA